MRSVFRRGRTVAASAAICFVAVLTWVFVLEPKGVVLTVAGHTHGGQVDLPFIGRPIVPSLYGERFAAGHIVEDGRHLFVSTGLGTSIIPVRFRVPPEVSLLELRAPPAGQP